MYNEIKGTLALSFLDMVSRNSIDKPGTAGSGSDAEQTQKFLGLIKQARDMIQEVPSLNNTYNVEGIREKIDEYLASVSTP